MNTTEKAANRLIYESSPYLLQHAYNPVDWRPWGDEAFAKAKSEDKPVFLSIGYSTCHWCHVMERESFEDPETSDILNEHFISIKVDKEERPDIDSVYMRVCQILTGSGGWPLTIIMTPEKQPFYAGTYLPKNSRRGMPGLVELLEAVWDKWLNERDMLTDAANAIVTDARKLDKTEAASETRLDRQPERCAARLERIFDKTYGGFGSAPKFPSPHNLLFLMDYYLRFHETECLRMAETTLTQMYKGGIFDHIGFGFSRYSTDRQWLAPHFEKMLYDNALLHMAYTKAFMITNTRLYKDVAYKISDYVFRELTSPDGAFYCAQDADSGGVEGRYYLFTPEEVAGVLGKEAGQRFNELYDITEGGNFEGGSIPNLLKSAEPRAAAPNAADLAALREYRSARAALHKDDKILTAWNGLMIAALAAAYKVFGDSSLLSAAEKAAAFIEKHLAEGARLYASYREGRRGAAGFLDDYAYYIMALIELYGAAFQDAYLDRAVRLCDTAVREFYDSVQGGFYLYGVSGEPLLFAPKETYDGAMPSGNSVMTHNLLMLSKLTHDPEWERLADEQAVFMNGKIADYPEGYCFFMKSLLLRFYPPKEIVCALKDEADLGEVEAKLPKDAIIRLLRKPADHYPLINSLTTFYVCEGGRCLPPSNELIQP